MTAANPPAASPAGPVLPPSDAELRERFSPVFARIAAGAVERERRRVLPRAEVGWLRDAGFTTIRVPEATEGFRLSGDAAVLSAAEVDAYRAQSTVIDLVLRATADLFEVGGASATDQALALDRHWRNARSLAQHNPVIYRQRIVGDYLLNGQPPAVGRHAGVAPSLFS